MGPARLRSKHDTRECPLVDGTWMVGRTLAESPRSRVLQATDVNSGRSAALKVVARENPRAFPQLLNEYRALVDIDHANVIGTHGVVAVDDQSHALVLDHLPGKSLLQGVHHEGPMSVGIAVEILTQLADALHATHEAGWLHCDVKPSNVVLREGKAPTLIDFGVARRLEDYTPASFSGTLSFASPEQVRGEPLDERSDVYSFGATAYFLLTGRPPYLFEDLAERFRSGPLGPPPRLAVATGLPFPADLENTIATMLSLDREDRPRSMRLVRALLEALDPGTLEFDSAGFLAVHNGDDPTVADPDRTAQVTPVPVAEADAPRQELHRIAEAHAPDATLSALSGDNIVYALRRRTLVHISGGWPRRVQPIKVGDLKSVHVDAAGVLNAVTDTGKLLRFAADGAIDAVIDLDVSVSKAAVGLGLVAVVDADGEALLSRDDGESWWCQLDADCTNIAVAPGGEFFAVANGREVSVHRLHPRSFELIETIELHADARHLACSDDGRVCVATSDGSLLTTGGSSDGQRGALHDVMSLQWRGGAAIAVVRRSDRLVAYQITNQ